VTRLSAYVEKIVGPRPPKFGYDWVIEQLQRIDQYSGKAWHGMDNWKSPSQPAVNTGQPSTYEKEKAQEDAWE
jgi:hypothetical protein